MLNISMVKTLVSGVIGCPVRHSLSPEIFQWIAKKLGAPAAYSKIEISPQELVSYLRVFKNLPFLTGWNVTIPHKQSIIPWLDVVSDEAERVGAVNVVQVSQGKWKGFNTDVIGVAETFREHGLKLKGKSALILGAGGAALSVGYVLGQGEAQQVYIANRNIDRAKEAAKKLGKRFLKTKFFALSSEGLSQFEQPMYLYVNATPLGMQGFNQKVYFPKKVKDGAFAFDVVYRPEVTPFLVQAKNAGLKPIGGLDMLIWQAIGAWEIWMDNIPKRRLLKAELKKHLQKKLRKLDS